jgi:predicted glutamine amidotransferase
MCGLNGAFGEIGLKERNALNLLSMFSQVRGRHSTGMGLVYKNRQRQPTIIKAVGGQESLVKAELKHFIGATWTLLDNSLRCVIGHNRHATVGGINKENAHPFRFGDIIGCHNGTIPLYSLSHLDEHKHSLTDSQILIAELGSGTAIKEVVEFAQGAWAVVWYDYKKHTLHMVRNKQRTLYVSMSLNKKTILWASEAWMLRQALEYVGLTEKYDVVKSVVTDKHLTWSTERHNDIKLRIGDAAGGKSRPYVNVTPHATGIRGWWPLAKKASNVVSLPNKNGEAAEVEEAEYIEEYTKGFKDALIHRRGFEKLIEDGCSWCTGALFWEDRESIGWFDRTEPLCLDCAQHLRDKYSYNVTDRKVN